MLTSAQKDGLGVALNEATLLHVEISEPTRTARIRFAALSIGVNESTASASVTLVLHPVGRVVASLREGRWDDPGAAVTPFALTQLPTVLKSFGGLPVYGWEFFDTAGKELALWGARLSLDWQSEGRGGNTHSLALFQDGHTRHLDLCFYFDELEIENDAGQHVPLDVFVAGGQRWWEAFRDGDPRTRDSGMFPLQ